MVQLIYEKKYDGKIRRISHVWEREKEKNPSN